MDKTRASKDPRVESSSSSSRVGDGEQNSKMHRRLEESAKDHLQKALDVESPEKKDYHIRSALQALVTRAEEVPTKQSN